MRGQTGRNWEQAAEEADRRRNNMEMKEAALKEKMYERARRGLESDDSENGSDIFVDAVDVENDESLARRLQAEEEAAEEITQRLEELHTDEDAIAVDEDMVLMRPEDITELQNERKQLEDEMELDAGDAAILPPSTMTRPTVAPGQRTKQKGKAAAAAASAPQPDADAAIVLSSGDEDVVQAKKTSHRSRASGWPPSDTAASYDAAHAAAARARAAIGRLSAAPANPVPVPLPRRPTPINPSPASRLRPPPTSSGRASSMREHAGVAPLMSFDSAAARRAELKRQAELIRLELEVADAAAAALLVTGDGDVEMVDQTSRAAAAKKVDKGKKRAEPEPMPERSLVKVGRDLRSKKDKEREKKQLQRAKVKVNKSPPPPPPPAESSAGHKKGKKPKDANRAMKTILREVMRYLSGAVGPEAPIEVPDADDLTDFEARFESVSDFVEFSGHANAAASADLAGHLSKTFALIQESKDARGSSSTTQRNIVRFEGWMHDVVASEIARTGLMRWRPDVRQDVNTTYNDCHRWLCIHILTRLVSHGAFRRMGINREAFKNRALLLEYYDEFFLVLRTQWQKTEQNEDALVEAAQRKRRLTRRQAVSEPLYHLRHFPHMTSA